LILSALDPTPSDNELLRMKAERDAKREGKAPASGTEPEERVKVPAATKQAVTEVTFSRTVFRGALIELSGVVHGAPRTKKNHKQSYAKESAAYCRFRDGVIEGFLGKVAFPEIPLLLEAHFYVDAPGRQADLVGLLQGFCDALENAAVVPNDWWIQAFDGSRVHKDQPERARVEFKLSPL
jgi:hypothetical protein